jgi:hypothetical protein
MIIVMENLNAVKPGESAALYFARGVLTQAVPGAAAGRPAHARRRAVRRSARQRRLSPT